MIEKNRQDNDVLERFLAGKASEKDLFQLEKAYNSFERTQDDSLFTANELEYIGDHMYQQIQHTRKRNYRTRYIQIISAAALVLFFAIWGVNQLITDGESSELIVVDQILPLQSDGIVAILPDGQQVNLNAQKSGIVVADGEMQYLDGSNADGGAVSKRLDVNENQSITIRTPKGSQYSVRLSDGTTVWLNAETQLTYPLTFNEKQREVSVEGEAFFTVNKEYMQDKKTLKPFLVHTDKQLVSVKGTSFNVREYNEEDAAKTSVNSGKVEVKNKRQGSAVMLLPNQQAISTIHVTHKESINAMEVSSWKDGYFIFEDALLTEVAQSLSRWYGIEVQLKGNVNQERYQGKISNKDPLSKILRILKASNVRHTFNKNILTLYYQ